MQIIENAVLLRWNVIFQYESFWYETQAVTTTLTTTAGDIKYNQQEHSLD